MPTPPTFVVVPVRDRLDLTTRLIGQLTSENTYASVFVYDNGSAPPTASWLASRSGRDGIEAVPAAGRTLCQMWNDGAARARARSPVCNIAFLNNDLVLGPGFLSGLATGLRSEDDLWAVSPNYDGRPVTGVERTSRTFKGGGMAGFAFMVRGEAFDDVAFDERFEWWFGDDDLVAQIEAHGGRVGIVGDVAVEHIGGGSQTVRFTPDVLRAVERDRRRMWFKWGAV